MGLLEKLGGAPEQLADTTVETANIEAPAEVELNIDNYTLTNLEKKALSLLGSGLPNETVASALGVDPSRISQLLSIKEFREKVTTMRMLALQKHNDRDNAYDAIEDKLLDKLKASLPLMVTPKTIMEAIKVVNGAKRRGSSNQQNIATQNKVATLVLPTQVIQQFTVNTKNQVIQAGNQVLQALESGNLDKLIEAKQQDEFAAREVTYDQQSSTE